MKHIHYLMVIGLLSVFTIVNGKNMVSGDDDNNQQSERTMPKGRLLRVEFSYQGMRMEPFGNFDLKRSFTKVKVKGKVKEEVKSEFNFYRYQNEATLHDVPDTLFDAARRIIEEEHMYEYAPSYNLPPGRPVRRLPLEFHCLVREWRNPIVIRQTRSQRQWFGQNEDVAL